MFKISIFPRYIAVFVMVSAMFLGIMAFASNAHAQTYRTTASTPSISDLQAQIEALMEQLNRLRSSSIGYSSPSYYPPTSPSAVFGSSPASVSPSAGLLGVSGGSTQTEFTRNLGLGDRNAQVKALKQCLSDFGFFNGTVNNAYNTATQRAVQAFQAENDIVSSGNPWTTGYGYVGPKTRRALNQECRSSVLPTPPPPGEDSDPSLTASPKSGDEPLKVTFRSNYGNNAKAAPLPDSGYVAIDYGDGSNPVRVDCEMVPSPAAVILYKGECDTKAKFTHTYEAAGTYRAKLVITGGFVPAGTPDTVLDRVTIKVGEGSSSDPDPVPNSDELKARPTSGDAPLAVRFSTDKCESLSTPAYNAYAVTSLRVHFGDGTSRQAFCNAALAWDGIDPETGQRTGGTKEQYTITHTYDEPGTYRAKLQDSTKTYDAVTINVGGSSGSGSDDDILDQLDDITGEEVYAKINFTKTNRSNSNPHGKNVLVDGTKYGDNEWFPLTENGEWITDGQTITDERAQSFNGFIIKRNNGRLEVTHYGGNDRGYELAEGRIVVKNGKIVKSSVKEVQFEDHSSNINNKVDTKYNVDYTRYDSQGRVMFGTYVSSGKDTIQLRVKPAGEVLGISISDLQLEATVGNALSDLQTAIERWRDSI